ncbi:MAG: SAM-dependent methyltransferase, partial [Deltaproteobacteria bacterium]|nr:SAM-dependent methyltransferase [Deltaproteobacteria bacterium]
MMTQRWNPGELLEVSGAFWKTCALHAAVKLDVFSVIGNDQLSAETIATKINGSLKGVDRLLNALVAMDLLEKNDDVYLNIPGGRDFLSRQSDQYIGHIILHHHHLVEGWSQLDQAVLTGDPIRSRSSFSKEEWRESFLLGMFNLAMNLAPQLVPLIDLSTRRHLLDLGGGPGTYAIHFCQKNPQLKATVFDLPSTKPFAEKTIDKFRLADRIDFLAGNYVDDEIEGKYDAAWLSHILHGEGPQTCREIIHKTVSALEPGATIVVHDFILDNSMDGPLFPA